jgi:hypothetical protein
MKDLGDERKGDAAGIFGVADDNASCIVGADMDVGEILCQIIRPEQAAGLEHRSPFSLMDARVDVAVLSVTVLAKKSMNSPTLPSEYRYPPLRENGLAATACCSPHLVRWKNPNELTSLALARTRGPAAALSYSAMAKSFIRRCGQWMWDCW